MQTKAPFKKAIIKWINDVPTTKAGDVQDYNPGHEGPKKLRKTRARRPQKLTRARRPQKTKQYTGTQTQTITKSIIP